jgi:dihydroorotate dehydrogenase (fumarate)
MADLNTTYMGIPLKNPILAGASTLTMDMDSVKQLEDSGVAAVVTGSLFEEQLELERFKFDEDLEKFNYRHPEMITVTPSGLEFAGPEEHLVHIRKIKEAVRIPVIASLNAVHHDTWLEYAKLLEQTGVDALECNFFSSPGDPQQDGAEIERQQINLVQELKQLVTIPLSIKLSFFYSNPSNVILRMDRAGADAFVLFNRMFEPDLDVQSKKHIYPFNFSHDKDYRLPLRYAGLLDGMTTADICSSTGIYNSETVIKMILAGAAAVQTVSALYCNGTDYPRILLSGIRKWMDEQEYKTVADFRGLLGNQRCSVPWAYTRAQYVQLLMHPEEVINNAPVF